MVEKVSREAEAKYLKYMKLRETLAKILQEKAVAQGALEEVEALLGQLKELSEDTELYKLTGYVLIKTKRDDVLKELEEKKDDLEIKLKALESQEKKLREDIERLAEELKRMLGGAGVASVGG
ncbi:MAG: prefoldin subunit beta [Desulfurococcales archaeon]|nr:prefoldin subunit beta [Desulfurococcales archaeon]MEB3789792.1 prefoldin subunit beta [Desulfurococcales archaeon]